MSYQDPISDFFIRIKNAGRAGHEVVQLPVSKFKYEIAKVLEKAGLISKIERKRKKVRKVIDIVLKSRNGRPAIGDVRLISKPSRRLYASYKDLRPSRKGGVIIVSTSRGVMSLEEARNAKIGGQLIAEVW